MKKIYLLFLLIFSITLCVHATDSIPKRKSFFKKFISNVSIAFKNFTSIDTNYIEPQHYNFTAMLQNTSTYEHYRINNKKDQSIRFSPEPSVKLGPYLGWRWIFLGYTLDINHLRNNNKEEYDFSIYSSQIGIDVFYRRGKDYRIKSISLGKDVNTEKMNNIPFDGFKSSVKGGNLYYIFNHHKFSYPAAFSQSTIQKISCGSPLVGIGYTEHTIDIDWSRLDKLIREKMGTDYDKTPIDSSLFFRHIKYTDFAISGGYAYNWAFAHNWLFASSLSLGIAYKTTVSDMENEKWSSHNFSFKNMNIDGIGRFSIVWNNMKWYAGASAIVHTYNYNKDRFSTNTIFGNFNIYVGFNFNKKKQYR